MNRFWDEHPKMQEELYEIQKLIMEVNHSSERYLDKSIDYAVTSGGKMVRPAFVVLSASFGKGVEKEKLHNMSAAIETLHLATLIHDDIIDDSDLRRGKKTIQSKYSKEYAVYMGDYLFTQCFMMLSKYDYTRENLYNISRGISKISIAEMKQSQFRYNIDVTIKDYLKVISGKTAGLFAVSLGSGAYVGGAEEQVAKKLGRIGYNIGMAFQIVDDLLDFSPDSIVGKDTLKDINNGYYTLPVIFALRSKYSVVLKQILLDNIENNNRIHDAIDLIRASGAIEKTEKLAKKYTRRALENINELPESWGKEVLVDIVPKLLKRIY